jgi:hypothetical protein
MLKLQTRILLITDLTIKTHVSERFAYRTVE